MLAKPSSLGSYTVLCNDINRPRFIKKAKICNAIDKQMFISNISLINVTSGDSDNLHVHILGRTVSDLSYKIAEKYHIRIREDIVDGNFRRLGKVA